MVDCCTVMPVISLITLAGRFFKKLSRFPVEKVVEGEKFGIETMTTGNKTETKMGMTSMGVRTCLFLLISRQSFRKTSQALWRFNVVPPLSASGMFPPKRGA